MRQTTTAGETPTDTIDVAPPEPSDPAHMVEVAAEQPTAMTVDPAADTADTADVTDTAADAEPADSEPAEVEAPEPVLVPHRTAGRYLKVAAGVAAALFVATAAFAGASLAPYLADRAIANTKFVVAETAASAITTLWTYTPDDMDKLADRSAKYLGGDFASEYRRYIDAIVAPNKQAQITNNTQVMGAAVESLNGNEASAIVYTNSVATSPVTKGAPSLRYISYRLAMKRQGVDWLITRMSPLTSLNVTPRI
jgi:Mce-associated membrane protein